MPLMLLHGKDNAAKRDFMMMSSNGNIFRVTGPLCGEFTGPGDFPAQRPVTRSFDVFFICAWINDWVNNRQAGDFRRLCGHYDVNIMLRPQTANWNLGMNSLIRAGTNITNNYIYSRRVWMFPLLLARTCRRKNNRVAGGLSRRDASVIFSTAMIILQNVISSRKRHTHNLVWIFS